MIQMRVYIKQQTTGRLLQQSDRRIHRLPKLTRIGMRRWGNTLAKEMVKSAKEADIKRFTGRLFQRTRWIQTENSNYGQLVMPEYAIPLDRMEPHKLWFRKSYGMRLRWGMQAQNNLIREWSWDVKRGKKAFFNVRVKPHPFMERAWTRSRKELRRYLREQLDKPAVAA